MESPIVKMETSEPDEFIPKQDVKIEELENQTINPEIVRVKIEGEPREMEEDINLDDLKFNISADTPLVKIKEEAETEELENPDFVCVHALKNEEVDIKSEENLDSENSSWKNLFKDTDPKIDRVSDEKCPKVLKSDSAVHPWFQKQPEDVLYSCNQCDYKTPQKKYLNRHIRGHENPDESKMHKCNDCDYKSIYEYPNDINKSDSAVHRCSQKRPEEDVVYSCNQCDYKTLHKKYLNRHIRGHEKPDESKMHKCINCDYKTIHKGHLKVHQVLHKNIAEVSTYQCNQCGFQTVYKRNIKIHLNRHIQPKETDMYKCYDCDFKTLHKRSLKDHVIRHKNISEVCLYRCKDCEYKTMIKSYLIRHELRHKNHEDNELNHCNECGYKSVYKSNLKRHMFNHKNHKINF